MSYGMNTSPIMDGRWPRFRRDLTSTMTWYGVKHFFEVCQKLKLFKVKSRRDFDQWESMLVSNLYRRVMRRHTNIWSKSEFKTSGPT